MCLAYDREEDIRTVFKKKLFIFFSSVEYDDPCIEGERWNKWKAWS